MTKLAYYIFGFFSGAILTLGMLIADLTRFNISAMKKLWRIIDDKDSRNSSRRR